MLIRPFLNEELAKENFELSYDSACYKKAYWILSQYMRPTKIEKRNNMNKQLLKKLIKMKVIT